MTTSQEFGVRVLDEGRAPIGQGQASLSASGIGYVRPSACGIEEGPHILVFEDGAEWPITLAPPDYDGRLWVDGFEVGVAPPPFRV